MDIDIDLPTNFNPADFFDGVNASMIQKGCLTKHPCGMHFQSVPIDPVTKLCALPYKDAEAVGYFKVDFLHLSILDNFKSKDEIRKLINTEPNWNLLKQEHVVQQLFHLGKWKVVIDVVEPSSVVELADCLALIRPKKQYLLHQYKSRDINSLRNELYNIEPGDKTSFKRSHAISYAHVIVLQLHLLDTFSI